MATNQKQDDKRKYIDSDLTKVKALENGAFEGIVATNGVDRHGEVINIEGIDTKTYLSTNPIVLFGHDYWEAESIIGRAVSLTKTKSGKLLSNFELFIDDNPKALLVSKLIKKGVCSLSIGFVPKEIEGDEYTKSEMVEFSVVPVPANGEAAITARSLGLTKKDMGAIRKAFADNDHLANMITITDNTVEVKDITDGSLADNKITEVKGAVADEIEAEEQWEKKWANMREFWDIVYAFCDVYYDEETDVDDFTKLLSETLGLLGQLSGNDEANEDDGNVEDETEYASVAAALKDIDADKVKALMDAYKKSRATDTETAKEKATDANKTTTKSIADDGDVTFLQQFAQSFGDVVKQMGDMHTDLQKAAEAAAGGTDDADEAEVEQSGTDDKLSSSNTVRDADEVVEDGAVEDEEVETKHKEIDFNGIKLDITDVKADNLKQLATALKAAAVELEEDATNLASSTTDGVTSPTTRKRKYVLRQAKKKVVTVDKMVELTLRQLNNN